MRRFRRPEAEPGGHPDARFGSARGVAPVAPLPPPRPSPTRNASPAQNLGCVKVDVSQLRKSSCLLTPAEVHRHLQHPQTALGAGLSNPSSVRGSSSWPPCQNRSLKLSTARGALQQMSSFRLRLTRNPATPAKCPPLFLEPSFPDRPASGMPTAGRCSFMGSPIDRGERRRPRRRRPGLRGTGERIGRRDSYLLTEPWFGC